MNIGMGNEAGLSLVRHKSIDLSPYYYGEKIGERKPFTSQQRKKKKSINKQARKSRKKNRK